MRQNPNLILIIISILLQTFAGIFGKYASATLDSFSITSVILNSFYMLSLICLFLQAIVWQQVLKHYHLSFAYPLMSLVNFVILLPAFLLFNESVTIGNIIGLGFISGGVYFLSRNGGGREV